MRYDDQIAYHYSAYRPPLHFTILERALIGFGGKHGLDIGSGAGHSTHALLKYCESVVGIEPSESMRSVAKKHNNIQYLSSYESLPASHFDIITFAGSLNYCKDQQLIHEISRVCRPGGLILVYDFELELKPLLSVRIPQSDYIPDMDLEGLQHHFQIKSHAKWNTRLELNYEQLLHMVLSDQHIRDQIPSAHISQILKQQIGDSIVKVEATSFFKLYQA